MLQTPDLENTTVIRERPVVLLKNPEGSKMVKSSRWERFKSLFRGNSPSGPAELQTSGPAELQTSGPENPKRGKDFCLPVYLDEGAVHTVYNEVKGLVTLRTEIERRKASSENRKRAFAAEGGVDYLFGKVKAGGSKETTDSEETGETSKAGYSRTCQAVFNELRSELQKQDLLTELADSKITTNDLDKLSEYDFVELSGHVYPNPIVRTLSVITELTNLNVKDEVQAAQATVFSDLYSADALPARAKKFVDASKTDSKLSIDENPNTLRELAELVPKSLSTICSTLASADVKLFVAYLTNLQEGTWRYPVVMTLFTGWARDKSMTEISDRQFRILGKVVRNCKGTDSVDLFRGTKYNGLGNYLNLSLIVPYFTALATQLKNNLPDKAADQLKALEEKDVLEAQFGWNPLETLTIQAPVLEIVPLALYL